MVVGGAPSVTKYHATLICDMALDMCEVITELEDPSSGESLQIRVGKRRGSVFTISTKTIITLTLWELHFESVFP